MFFIPLNLIRLSIPVRISQRRLHQITFFALFSFGRGYVTNAAEVTKGKWEVNGIMMNWTPEIDDLKTLRKQRWYVGCGEVAVDTIYSCLWWSCA